MRFDKGIARKYRKSVEDAFQTILEKGDNHHREVTNDILESKMLVRVKPVAEINASGITGLIDPSETNARLGSERLNPREAFGEVYIAIANETIDTGRQRGCEGTFVHEGRHAYDFAQTISSISNVDINPLSVFNPTLYDLEWEAHKTAGNYMLQVNLPEYLSEGLSLLILGQKADGSFFVNDDGIRQRLRDSYGLALDGNQGSLASEMLGIRRP
jgi:hypothetical protein